jgi:phage terminase large subunit-like protein
MLDSVTLIRYTVGTVRNCESGGAPWSSRPIAFGVEMTGRRLVAEIMTGRWSRACLKGAKPGLLIRLLHALRAELARAGPVSAVPARPGDRLSPSWALAMISQTRSGLPKVRRL